MAKQETKGKFKTTVMDKFKEKQLHNNKGGRCSLKDAFDNPMARKGDGKVDKKLNKAARSRIKFATKKEISNG